MKRIVLGAVCLFLYASLQAQETFPVNGVRDARTHVTAFTHATIHTNHQTTLEDATLLIQEDRIIGVGNGIEIPKNAKVIDLEGKHIYPSFIDLHTSYGMPEVKRPAFRRGGSEVIQPQTKGPYNQNDAIKAHINAVEVFKKDEKWASSMRGQGFGAVLTHHPDGLARGTSAFVTLHDGTENKVVLKGKAGAHYSFAKGTSTMNYPSSIMGYMALLRQTMLDATWYQQVGKNKFHDEGLEAMLANKGLPQFFTTRGKLNFMRADKLGDEFGVQYVIKGTGDEYQNLDWIKKSKAPIILPLNFPKAYDVTDPYDALNVSLAQMKHWELAPSNPARLIDAGMTLAFTTDGIRNKKGFMAALQKAIKAGLSEEMALKSLTSTPAELAGVNDMLGTLDKGKLANFIITSDNVFSKGNKIYHNVIQGKSFPINALPEEDIRGEYILEVSNWIHKLSISGTAEKPSYQVISGDSTKLKTSGSFKDGWLTLSYSTDKSNTQTIRLSGTRSGTNLSGEGQMEDGDWVSWVAKYRGPSEAKGGGKKGPKGKMGEKKEIKLGDVIFPFVAYGSQELPQQEDVLFQNATVWTNEADGKVEGMDVLVKDGKIAKVGKRLKAGKAKVIDGSGMHLTPGVIDEHSHIALSGVNDVAIISSMVKMKDAVDHESINMYRQLSGGVVAAQLLHGSANPIGGQSALVKFRWGQTPDGLLIKDADEYIKFALGENVKRSRSSNSIRFPQSRMGVEMVYVDGFTRALEYGEKWKAYKANPASTEVPRQDLALDALLEIINKERFITCHSYVQSEITMLMRVAERFGFRVNTFTHILEGYKVADKMAKHGVGGSSFADWWGYKFEVYEAIPYNATLMAAQGVTVAINSDNAEMARRLNQEAAKSVKYGGMSEEDAFKMVTLNPAKLLHLDHRMGSIKVGKDADLVLWTDHPLSIYAKSAITMVDGTIYYSLERDEKLREEIQAERMRLIEKMKSEKKAGGPTQRAWGRPRHSWHCDEIIDYQLEATHGHD
ncbi:MAG: amidohydrolase family protein [Bacteroidota bacterium]